MEPQKAKSDDSNVSAGQAVDALEALTNIHFLIYHDADHGSRVRKLVRDTEPCMATLSRFLTDQRNKQVQRGLASDSRLGAA